MRSIFLFVLVFITSITTANNGQFTKQEYINTWKKTAQTNMQKYRIPASIILAQGILESNCGNSPLATEANNHFGIKCHEWTGDRYIHDDDKKDECFRKYRNASESYADHAEFLKNRARYSFLFQLDSKDYKGWAYGLKKAGYATNPNYPQLLIKIIEDNQLYKYDDADYIEPEPEVLVVVTPAKVAPSKQKKGSKKQDEITIYLQREVLVSDNRIKFISAKAGDTPQKIANDMEMGLWQILKYNDIDKTDKIKDGQLIYLQPKRRKGKIERHTFKTGETVWEISQLYGIKLSRIYKLNNIDENTKVEAGTVLKLR